MTNIDLTSIERKSYRSMFADGLLDIFAGVSLLFLGIMWLTEYAAFGGLMPALLIPIWPLARKRIVEPRSGYVRLGQPRRNRLRKAMIGGIALGTLTLMLAVGAYVALTSESSSAEAIFEAVGSGLPAFLLALMAGMAAWQFDLPRFFAYAGLLVCAGLIGIWLDVEPAWSLIGSAIIVTAAGVTLLARFVASAPIIEST